VSVSGNPVRMSMRPVRADGARLHFGLDPQRPTVLVFGGSLGASALNRAVRELVEKNERLPAQFLWQTGNADAESLSRLSAGRADLVVRSFIDEMDLAYATADVVICRAGATTVAELTLLGKVSILIPYPHAAADHQRENARVLADANAAILLPQERLGELERVLLDLLADEARRGTMARNAKACGNPDAAKRIAAALLALIERRQRT
jgi:UDP-N-acetylglucosamine--N-acetylmuramyl-(pentapeptide) pyrophosphoryl-undecaprenol N-acetylglucosamine transferase